MVRTVNDENERSFPARFTLEGNAGNLGKRNLFGGQKKDGIRMQWAQRMRLYRISSLLWS